MEKFYYKGSNGRTNIAAYAWFPNGEIKGLVYFAHGIMEYAERHNNFFELLAQNGYCVIANDHMGHGNSQDVYPMFFHGRIGVSGWNCACNDAYMCIYNCRKKFNISKDIPLYGIGFSLGSFIIQTVAIRNPSLFTGGIILLSTGTQNPIKTIVGKIFAMHEANRYGVANTTPQVFNHTFGKFNKHFNQRTIADWFCLNRKSLDKYLDDDKCGKEITVGLLYDLLEGIEYTGNFFNIKQMDTQMPILILAGSRDAAGNFSKDVKKLHKRFLIAGLNSTCVLYNHMRHDILHEVNSKKVHQEIIDFLGNKQCHVLTT